MQETEIFEPSFTQEPRQTTGEVSHMPSDNPPEEISLNGVTPVQFHKIQTELKQLNHDENIVWIGRSSQKIHLGAYCLCMLFFWLIIPVFIAYYLYIKTKNTIYVLTAQRLHIYSGILTKRIDDIELYRIKDICYIQPFILWMFHLSSIQMVTSDPNWVDLQIPGIQDGLMLREKLRRHVEEERDRKGVKEVDYYAQAGPVSS